MVADDADILGLSPLEQPDVGLVAAISQAGASGILDLGRDQRRAKEALDALSRALPRGFGVRIPEGASFAAADLPPAARVVVLPPGAPLAPYRPRRVYVQVTSVEEARAAAAAGADGLIAKGHESGGRVGEESAFVLSQRLAAEIPLPLYVQGGIGLHTAAACLAGGAAGVVLDSQLALVRESSLPAPVRAVIAAMDGSETAVIHGMRVVSRPDLASADGLSEDALRARLGACDPRTDFLAAGQDAAFARPLAERFHTAGGVIRAFREAMASSLRTARALRPLAPGAPLAAAHGTRFPILQGPMTRVSDRAAFAAAVAEAGGLPFLALSLLRAREARPLLEETRARLGGRPFGVGVLGFVPQPLRDEQLALLADLPPPFALIAGGRPSQARALEARGVATYLHVPSPGLLDLFLKDGARRFVFEGRECGGHVGPRTSFVLWEAQVERLLAHPAPEELHVVFAGGIHDARSAAMVAALAAPLAARGARIGVLMGTAYLFTREAVSSGAIGAAFQDAALACDRTVLLETAPGHATRCVDSDYVRAFQEEKRRLEARGLGPNEVWAALEELNLGRLRIASKGIVREGESLVPVGEDVQRRDGMFMIGQVAALRDRSVSIAELHDDVSAGSAERLAALPVPAAAPQAAARPADIAIIGIACRFPGASDRAAFWANVVRGVSSVTEVPRERWSADLYYDPKGGPGKTPSKWGGFLSDAAFDPTAYGIPPRSLAAIEPVQILSLDAARAALADAGYESRDFDRERTSVIFGAESGTDLAGAYGFRALYPQYVGPLPKALDEHLPSLTEDSFPGVLANIIAGRIANRLDLGGVSYTVDAACASSLAAVDLAVKELTSGESDMVVCGGADLHNSINDYLMFASVHALSPRGQCRTFDAEADGIVLGEGVAVLVLKRLADAERDGDRVYAVIKSIAGASDGKSLGLTAPRPEGQIRALERAYRRAGVSPAEVELVEAHGTGTVVGDRTELATLTDVYGRAGAAPRSCTLGSVKSQIGHTKCAAGMAGLAKAALALHHGVLPPTLHVERPNPFYDPDKSPFVFSGRARPWPSERRHAAVSAFGFGGANFHAVLAAPDRNGAPSAALDEWPAELFLFRGAERAQAIAAIGALEARLAQGEPWRLRDLARSVNAAGRGSVQVAVVASDLGELREKLAAARALRADGRSVFVDGGVRGKVAFLFPGQGSQRPGMLGELFVAFPALHRHLRLGARWFDRMFPPAAFTPEARAAAKAALTDTRVAQPALGIAGFAMAELLGTFGVRPELLGGHSYGELVALAVAGVFAPSDLLELSEARGECMLAAAGDDPGSMAAVAADASATQRALGDLPGVVLANHNAPDQTVIAGPREAVKEALARLEAARIGARPLPVACAFHSPLVAPARDAFGRRLAAVGVAPPSLPVWSNTTALPYPTLPDAIRARLAEHLALPVRFREQIEAMYEAGARVFVEAGPGRVLTGLVGRILGDRPHAAVACDSGGDDGIRALLCALAELAVSGVAIDAEALHASRDARVYDLAHAPSLHPPATAWLVNGQRARPLHGDLPPHAMRPITAPLGAAAAPAPAADSPEAVVLEYLRGVREMIETQREVMLAYLGQAPAARAPRETVPAPAEAAPAPVVPLAAAPRAAERPMDALVAIVSDRTGYPAELLQPDLDLEADLSIDSIKRIEILGLLGERLGLALEGAGRDQMIEELAARKTLRGIVEYIEARAAGGGATREEAPPPAPPAGDPSIESAVQRYLLSLETAPNPEPGTTALEGRAFAITDDGRGVAHRLAELLRAEGATARLLPEGERPGAVDGLVHLAPLASESAMVAGSTLELARDVLVSGARWLVAATGLGGDFGRRANGHIPDAGLSGFLKSVAKEWPDARVRAIDLDPGEPPEQLARHVFDELVAEDRRIEVGYRAGQRHVLSAVRAERRQEAPLDLGPESVVLVTGGARGITARIARALAERYRCRLELVGRSPLPGDEEPALATATDAPAVRRSLLAKGPTREPAAIEAECSRILTAREIRRTLSVLREAGSEVAYHALDVRDGEAFGALIDALYERHGRIDGVIHGAGVIEDKLLRDKTRDSFERVFDTKVVGAKTLARKLRSDVRFIAFFSSVSAFGNRGQADYAAANDALDKIAWAMKNRINGRVVSINWGPWAGTGMVSPALEREYASRGIRLIPADEGVDSFLEEIAHGSPEETQVILTGASAHWP